MKQEETAFFCSQRLDGGFSPKMRKIEVMKLAKQSPSAHIRALFERFLPDDQRVETLASASAEKILAIKGNAKRGARAVLSHRQSSRLSGLSLRQWQWARLRAGLVEGGGTAESNAIDRELARTFEADRARVISRSC